MATITAAYALSSTSIYVQWTDGIFFVNPYTVLWNGGAGPSNSGPIETTGFLNSDYTITGLISSTSYTITVSNGIGTISDPVNVTTLSAAPGQPTSLSAAPTGQSGQVQLNWTASNPGGPGTTYVIQSSTDQINWNNNASTTDVSIVVPGFQNGVLYFFDVYATNQFGYSPTSNVASATPYTIPGAPYLSASGGNAQVTLNWTTPDNGGLTIIYYLVYVNGVSQSTGSTATSLILTGLNNGQPYSFQVAAVSTNGQSAFEGALSNVATATPSTLPGAPAINNITSSNNGPDQPAQVTLFWTAPTYDGGSPILYYLVYVNGVPQSTPTNATSYTVNGLTNGTEYSFYVAAVNNNGTGSLSNLASSTPSTYPGPPTSLSAASGQNSQVTLGWIAPTNDGGNPIQNYVVYVNGVPQSTPTNATSWIVTGLNNGTTYSFQVAAVNANGTGAISGTVNATPSTVPGPPNITSAASNGQSGQVQLIWTPPDSGGSEILHYLVYVNGVPQSTPTNATSFTVTGLNNGTTYSFQVAAVNANGTGAISGTVNATPSTVPGPPTNLSAASNGQSGQVQLIWTPPDNGGSAITDYLVQYSTDNSSWTTFQHANPVTGTTTIVTGLMNGQPYYFRVAAVNTDGQGPYSNVATATPSTVPDAPTNVSADTCDNQQATVTWTTPNNGGAAISSYNLQYSSPNAGGPWLPAPPFSVPAAPTNTYTFTGLTNGAQYFFRVAAVNSNGPGNYSDASNVSIPSITPNPPTSITAPTITSNSIRLSWVAPSNTCGNPNSNPIAEYQIYLYKTSPTGSIATIYAPCVPPVITPTSNSIVNDASSPTIYNVSSSPTSISIVNDATPPTTYTMTNLASNTLYAVQMSSANCSGIGPMSFPLIYVKTSCTTPSAPTNLIASGCNSGNANSVTLSWIAPSDCGAEVGVGVEVGDPCEGESAVTNYIVYYRKHASPPVGWITYNTYATTAVISFLETNTLYEFKVAAKNADGLSAFSPVVTARPCSPPTPPINLVATNPNDSIVLTWTPSQQSPPQTISYYFIEYNLETIARSVWTKYYQYVSPNANSLQLTNPPIANNVPYFFRVYAVNSSGGQSTPSNVVRAISYNYGTFVRPWSRAGGNNCPNCDSNYGYAACGNAAPPYSTYALDQRRKVEILKYKGNSAQLSQAQQYSMLSRNVFTRKKSWATQTQTYTNPNVNNLPEIKNAAGTTVALQCNQPNVICSLTSDSDVPGPVIPLCIDESVPLYNYKMQVTPASGGKYPVGLPIEPI